MTGDCGHGWGYHTSPSSPCSKCEQERIGRSVSESYVNNLVQQVHGLRAMNQRQTERIAALEAELELKQGIIIADDTKIKLLELELANRDRTIAELRQKLTKRDMMLENAAGYLSGSDYDNERAYAKKIIAFLDEAE